MAIVNNPNSVSLFGDQDPFMSLLTNAMQQNNQPNTVQPNAYDEYIKRLIENRDKIAANQALQAQKIGDITSAATARPSSRFMEGDQGFLDALKNPSESQRNLMIQFGLGLAKSDSTKDLSQRLAFALGPGIQSMQATREKEKQRNILTQQMNLKKLGLEQQGLGLDQSIQGNIYQAIKANQQYKLQLKKYNQELANKKGTNQYVNGREIFVDGSNNYSFFDGSAVSQDQLTNASPNKPNIPTIVNLINARNQLLSDPNADPKDIAVIESTIKKQSTHPPQADEFLARLGRNQADFLKETYQKTNLSLANEPLLDSLIKTVESNTLITGKTANFEEGLSGYLDELGLLSGDQSKRLADTQGFIAAQAQRVAQIITAFGSGTGLSDADREYALKAAGGDITMTKDGILRILKIAKKQTQWARQNHNANVNRIMKKYDQSQRDTMLFPDSGYVSDMLDLEDSSFRSSLEKDFGGGQ